MCQTASAWNEFINIQFPASLPYLLSASPYTYHIDFVRTDHVGSSFMIICMLIVINRQWGIVSHTQALRATLTRKLTQTYPSTLHPKSLLISCLFESWHYPYLFPETTITRLVQIPVRKTGLWSGGEQWSLIGRWDFIRRVKYLFQTS